MISDMPEMLSGEQVRCILHISKRKCAWMLNNGFIKCQDTGRKTRRYTVSKKDLMFYIEDSRQHPEKYFVAPGKFSAGEKAMTVTTYRDCSLTGFRRWLNKELKSVPDVLTVHQVIELTGYAKSTVENWLEQGRLQFVKAQSDRFIAKKWLIDFYEGYGVGIIRKSEKHRQLMKKFFEQSK